MSKKKVAQKKLLHGLIGLSKKNAVEKIKEAGMKHRVVCNNGKVKMGTTDYQKDRVKLILEKGKVTDAKIG